METLERRGVDICGIQEHRYKGALRPNQCKFVTGKSSRFKLFWCANSSGLGGTGLMLAERWITHVAEVTLLTGVAWAREQPGWL